MISGALHEIIVVSFLSAALIKIKSSPKQTQLIPFSSFNDAVSNPDYAAMSGWMIVNNELK
jgi:hypothetical protein